MIEEMPPPSPPAASSGPDPVNRFSLNPLLGPIPHALEHMGLYLAPLACLQNTHISITPQLQHQTSRTRSPVI